MQQVPAHVFLHPFPAPSAPPQEVHLISLSSTSIKVSWAAPPAASRHGNIVRYSLAYQAVSGEDQQRHEVKDIPADVSSYVLEGLEKWTEYVVWVKAHTDVGPGPESGNTRVRTKEDGNAWLTGAPDLLSASSNSPALTPRAGFPDWMAWIHASLCDSLSFFCYAGVYACCSSLFCY